MGKDMFEKFRDGELPKDLQEKITSSANIHGLDDEKNGGLRRDFLLQKKLKKSERQKGLKIKGEICLQI